MIVQGNAFSLPLADSSVDLVVTSPPYFALRSYQDAGTHYEGQVGSEETPQAFLEALWEATAEMVRVLKPSGSIFVNLGDKYAGSGGHNNSNLRPQGPTGQMNGRGIAKARDDARARAEMVGGGGADRRAEQREVSRRNAPDAYNKASIGGAQAKSLMLLPERFRIGCSDRLGLWVRQVLIWRKPNGLPESVTDRARRCHEDWVHLTKRKHYFANLDDIREPHAAATIARVQPHRAPVAGSREAYQDGMNPQQVLREQMKNPKGALPGSVWTIATEPLTVPEELGIDHFAAFPTEWPRRLILGWCPEGGTVLDPFGGTGTTAMVARALGRTGISLDLSHDYSRLAKWRVYESGHEKKAVRRTNASKQGAML